MDREDILYCIGGLSISAGCGFIYPPTALLCAGFFIILPAVVSMWRSKGPSK